MERGSTSREEFENIHSELDSDFEKLAEDKRKAGEIIDKFVKENRNPNLIEGLRTFYYALKLRARAEMIKDVKDIDELQRKEFIDSAHGEAFRMEEKHRELQQHVIDAVEELQKYEREELGKNQNIDEKNEAA